MTSLDGIFFVSKQAIHHFSKYTGSLSQTLSHVSHQNQIQAASFNKQINTLYRAGQLWHFLIKRKTLKPSLNYEGDDVISRISTGLLRLPSQENANVTLKPNM